MKSTASGDGIPDPITYGSSSAPGSLIPGFHSTTAVTLYVSSGGLNYRAAGTLPAVPIAIDADSDGKDDIVMFLPNIDSVTHVLVNWTMTLAHSNGDGTFVTKQTMIVTSTDANRGFNRGFAVGDINGDGHPGLIAGSMDDLMIFYGQADGTLREPVRRYLPLGLGNLAETGVITKRMYDVDGDGNLDLVFFSADSIRVLFGNGHGAFPRYSTVHVTAADPTSTMTSDQYLRGLAFGNFTSSSRTDIAAGASDGSVVIFSAQGAACCMRSRARAPA